MTKESPDAFKALDREIVYIGGERGMRGDFPVAVTYTQLDRFGGEEMATQVVDPLLTDSTFNNLYGRMLTLIEATTEPSRLKAVKNVFTKELNQWYTDVHSSAREIVNNGDSSRNVYTKMPRSMPASN